MNRNFFASGFTLVEVMITVAILGGLSLVTMSITKNLQQGQTTAEAKMEQLEIRRIMIMTLTDKTACYNSFYGIAIAGGNVPAIKNAAGTMMFSQGGVYGNNAIGVTSMTLQDTGAVFDDGTKSINLVVNFKKLKKLSTGTTVPAIINLRVKDNGGSVVSCFADSDAIIKQSCIASSGTWTGSSCSLNALYVSKGGDMMTGDLTAPNFLGNVNGTTATLSSKITSPLFCTGVNCKSIDNLALSNQTCPAGYVQKGVTSSGIPNCVALQCAANMFFAGLDAGGNPQCRPYPTNTCPTNQYVSSVNADGTVNCSPIPNNASATCPSGQVLQSIVNGAPSCVDRFWSGNASSIYYGGYVYAGSYFYSSDVRLKKDIHDFNDFPSIDSLHVKSFRWKKNNRQAIGLIAQDLEKVYPQAVVTNNNIKQIDQTALMAFLIHTLQKQDQEIKKLKEQIAK